MAAPAGAYGPIWGSITIDTKAFGRVGSLDGDWSYWAGRYAVSVTLADAYGGLTTDATSASLRLCGPTCSPAWRLDAGNSETRNEISFTAYSPSMTVGPDSVLFSPLAIQAMSSFDAAVHTPQEGLSFTWDGVTSVSRSSTPEILAIANGASFQQQFSPASWVSIFGRNLSASTRPWNADDFHGTDLPQELDGVRVQFGGRPGFPSYVSSSQINVLTPDDLPAQVAVQVANSQGHSAAVLVPDAALAPAFFFLTPDTSLGADPGRYVAAVHADGAYVGFPGMFIRAECRAARAGDVISLYGSGFGDTNPPSAASILVARPNPLASAVTVTIDGIQAEVLYAGLVGPGLYQINVRVPDKIDAPTGKAAVVAEVEGVRTQPDAYIRVI